MLQSVVLAVFFSPECARRSVEVFLITMIGSFPGCGVTYLEGGNVRKFTI